MKEEIWAREGDGGTELTMFTLSQAPSIPSASSPSPFECGFLFEIGRDGWAWGARETDEGSV